MVDFKNLKKTYLIAEIGINHNGDIEIAKKLIDAANACQWDCVKFQKRTPEICVPKDEWNVMRDTPWGKMSYIDYKKKIEFGKKEYDYIDNYCREKSISWTASVWDVPSLDFIASYNVPFIKIPSAKITDKELLIRACSTNKPLMISTGMSTIDEIDEVVDILKKNNCSQYILMHCNSSYPAPQNELNLKCIQTLHDRYKCPVGYSGHEFNLPPTTYAVVLGAKIIERHITLSHNLWGTDQSSSLEVMGMDMLRKRIIDIEKNMGDGVKIITETEKPIRKKLRGS
jgi:N-acetylneuraminate synthase